MVSPTNASHKNKLEQARAILEALGLSPERHGERSALTLLALAALPPAISWDQAKSPLIGLRGIMDFIRDHYDKQYAPNTRESIRKLSLQPFAEEGLILENPDQPRRKKTSSHFVYQLKPQLLSLLRVYGTPAWDGLIREYQRVRPTTTGQLASQFRRDPSDIRLTGLRLMNFRSMKDSSVIELRPLVILVGKNGSGKSSFLRFFPLLRQSGRTRSESPLAWYGSDVDMGRFSTVVRRGSGSEVSSQERIQIELAFALGASPGRPDEKQVTYTAILARAPQTNRDVIEECWIDTDGCKCILSFDKEGALEQLVVDGRDAAGEDGCAGQRESGTLIPRLLDASIPESSHWLAVATPMVLNSLNSWLNHFVSTIHYAAPVREAPRRQYRTESLSVGQIDPTGANLAMFLHMLGRDQREEFSEWAFTHLGFRIQLLEEGEWNVAVMIEEGGRQFNLIDMGYGYSQLLPVLLQAWSSSRGLAADARQAAPSFLAIEQPELHLHPAHQARLADMFVASYKAMADAGKRMQLVLETHSDALINRLGELVEEGRCSASDISVVLFEKDAISGNSSVRVCSFTEQGYLSNNWPVGFFAP